MASSETPPPATSAPAPVPTAAGRVVTVVAAVLLAGLFFVDDHRLDQSRLAGFVVEDSVESPIVEQARRLVRRAGFPLLALGGLAACVAVPAAGRRVAVPGVTFLLLCTHLGWAMLSVGWSEAAGETFRRLVVTVSIWASAAGLAYALNGRRLTAVIVAVPLLHLLVGYLAEIAYGTFAPWASGSRFVGTTHPNIQALQAATACLGALTVATWRTGAVPAAWRAAAIAAAGFALASVVLTKSRTVLAGLLIGMGIIALARGGWRLAVAGAWGGVFLCGVGVTLAGMTTIDLGKTGLAAVTLGRGEQIGTLTGRSAIWAETTRYVADRPWRGHGYAAFWDDEKRREKIWDKLGWPVTSSHSQWIDTTLELGLVGATLLALLLLSAACRAVRRGVFGGDDFALFAATLLLALIFNSFMESHLFVGTRYMSWVFVAVVLKLTVFADDDRTLRDPTATPIAAGLSP